MSWDRNPFELGYANVMRSMVHHACQDDIVRSVTVCRKVAEVVLPNVCDRVTDFSWYGDWSGWLDNMSFERRLRKCRKDGESFITV